MLTIGAGIVLAEASLRDASAAVRRLPPLPEGCSEPLTDAVYRPQRHPQDCDPSNPSDVQALMWALEDCGWWSWIQHWNLTDRACRAVIAAIHERKRRGEYVPEEMVTAARRLYAGINRRVPT